MCRLDNLRWRASNCKEFCSRLEQFKRAGDEIHGGDSEIWVQFSYALLLPWGAPCFKDVADSCGYCSERMDFVARVLGVRRPQAMFRSC